MRYAVCVTKHFASDSHVAVLRRIFVVVGGMVLVAGLCAASVLAYVAWVHVPAQSAVTQQLASTQEQFKKESDALTEQLQTAQARLDSLQKEDQRQKNAQLEEEIKNIHTTFGQTVNVYENIISLRDLGRKTTLLDTQLAAVFTFLVQRNYSSASAQLSALKKAIADEHTQNASAAAVVLSSSVAVSNTPPSAGYARQAVATDFGTFQIDIIAADLHSTRVVAETVSGGDCKTDCPVSSLADFVAKGGGYAGINGPYFCPAEYPSCADKKNSFDTLLMNRQKTYFNSENNIYSTVPAVIFSGSSARFVGASQEWGRDTSVDAVIAGQPLLLLNGEVRFGGDGDPKKGSRGSRSFIGTKGSTVYIGVVRAATVAEVARVLQKLGLEHALNLDSGGSTAVLFNGKYLAGPGRNTPFGIVFVRK
jgi:Skp family chaperone for outer membrane proteins